MNSVAQIRWLGDTEAFRTRGLNIGDNSFFDSDMWNRFHYKTQNISFIEDLGATILQPYMDNLCVYNMAKRKALNPGEDVKASILSDFRNRFTVPAGWVLGYTDFVSDQAGTLNQEPPLINFDRRKTREVKHFKPGGSYYDAGIGSETDLKSFEKWEDWYFRPITRQTVVLPDGSTKRDPVFVALDIAWGDQKLIYFGNGNNVVDDIYREVIAGREYGEALNSIRRWTIRSWDKKDPANDEKQYESSGQGISNALKSDQGVFLGLRRFGAVKSKAFDQIRFEFYKFRLYWTDSENKDLIFNIRFVFSYQMKLVVEFAVEYQGTDYEITKKYKDASKSMIIPFKNDALMGNGFFGMSVQFIDGKIVLMNVKNEVLAVINTPEYMLTKREDVLGKEYSSVTGDETLMQLHGYGACGVLLRPLMFYRNGFVESPEFRQGEKPNNLSTDITTIIPEELSSQNVQITTEIGPKYAEPGEGEEPESESSSEREEAWYKFQIMIYGNEVSSGSGYLFDAGEELSSVTPIVFDASITSNSVPLPAESDELPIPGVNNIDLLSLSFRKSIDDSNEYSSSSLDMVFSLYKDLFTRTEMDSETSILNRFINSPFILALGGIDSIKHDYSADHRGNHTAGSAYVNANITEMGIYFTDKKGRVRSSGDYRNDKLSFTCRDMVKRLENTIVLKKRTLDGLSHVDAIQELASWAYLSNRLTIPEASLELATDDPVLPISPNGGRKQWVCSIGDNVFDWIQRIRQFSGWIFYINNAGQMIYRHYDRTLLNRDSLAALTKYIFTDRYNWTDTGLIGQDKTILPISGEFTDLEFDNYRTRVSVTGINSEPYKMIVDAQQGKLNAKVGDRLSYMYWNKELEEKLGETRLAAYENKMISTVEGMRKVARSIGKIIFRQKKVVTFSVEIGEQMLDLELFDPIGVYESFTQKIELYEVSSISYSVSKNSIRADLEARSFPI